MRNDPVCKPVRRRPRLGLILCLLGLIVANGASLAEAQGAPRGISPWWPKVEEIEQRLRAKAWQKAHKSAHKLAEKVATEAWYDRELGAVLAELVLYQAIAELNLDRRDEAIWHWQMALNLSSQMKRRDLTAYGEAGKELSQLPLRHRGQKPPGLNVRDAPLNPSFQPARWRSQPEIPVLNNAAGVLEGTEPVRVEVVVDEKGHVHYPVVISDYLKPNVIYTVLEAYCGKAIFEPARINGEPVAILLPLVVDFHKNR